MKWISIITVLLMALILPLTMGFFFFKCLRLSSILERMKVCSPTLIVEILILFIFYYILLHFYSQLLQSGW